jgi:fructokinase
VKSLMADVVCLGEALVDLICQDVGHSLIEAGRFEKHAGGAPANVAVGLARLGASSAFIGKVGQDAFGDFLVGVLAANGVNTERVMRAELARTGLAFVTLDKEGEREFLFYRHPSADMLLKPDEVERMQESILEASVFHFGSLSLIHEPTRSATLRALEIAHLADRTISFDPNLRLDQWPSPASARDRIRGVLDWVDLLKVSEIELDFLIGDQPLDGFFDVLWSHGARLLVVTLGSEGCRFFSPTSQGTVPGFTVPVVDTTGAGDGFTAGLLFNVVQFPEMFERLDLIRSALRFANAVAAITTTCHGAMSCLPTREQVEELLEDDSQTKGEAAAGA